ncbi:MAG: exodeoxyribonuclease VII large subunit [Lachnospiraceae bacterium]|nr:exodeoxyribonuclease VII large subunit [Lachnospiraceae bacterium]
MANVYSVAQVNSYIKNMFLQDFMLNRIWIKGEVSNCKYHTSGHIYFTIKDQTGTIACVMFAGNRNGLSFSLQEGQTVVVEGSVRVYERDGKYQLYAKNITLDGAGLFYQKFEQLKQELEEMGMFSKVYKKPIPRFARTIGVVTASTGAAIRDIVTIARRRNPYVQLVLYPALVQGDGAKETIVQGISYLDRLGVDVIIVGRGGGSIEDLWAFNEECVARAIFACQTPVISAVGHEVDVTISDYVADLRAPTPSAAAELAVFDYRSYQDTLEEKRRMLFQKMAGRIEYNRGKIKQAQMQLHYVGPQNQVLMKRQRLLDLEGQLERRMERKLRFIRHQTELFAERLDGVSPFKRLEKGYAYVTDQDGRAFKGVGQAVKGEFITVKVADGEVRAVIKEVLPYDGKQREEGD